MNRKEFRNVINIAKQWREAGAASGVVLDVLEKRFLRAGYPRIDATMITMDILGFMYGSPYAHFRRNAPSRHLP